MKFVRKEKGKNGREKNEGRGVVCNVGDEGNLGNMKKGGHMDHVQNCLAYTTRRRKDLRKW